MIIPAIRIVMNPPTGSTTPESTPHMNAFFLLMPSLHNGIDIIAPSGKFCIAIPIARAIAAVAVIPESFIIAPANATPTDIPSGILCNVTAKSIIVVLDMELVLIPS